MNEGLTGSPGNISKDKRKSQEVKPFTGKRIVLIGDREILNFEAIRDFSNQHPDKIQPGGFIVPGGEIDQDIVSAVDYLNGMRSDGTGIPIEEENGSTGLHFFNPQGADFAYQHAPYEAKRLKEEEEYRKNYCLHLVDLVKSSKPDLIFLSNFKIILHPVFVEAFEGKIVNVHPSVLPLLKGFRPEHRAGQGEEPEANGYTIHLVDTDLDGGPTLLQQCVSLEPRDAKKEEELGSKEYEKRREEAHRLKIIQAEALWSPQVLELVASDTLRKIVSGEEAFTAEGRPGFSESEPYKRLLEKEYEEWKEKKENQNSQILFEEWKKEQKPYSRVLFDKGNGWQTAEVILNVSKENNEPGPDVITKYSFKMPGGNGSYFKYFSPLYILAEKVREERGMNGKIKSNFIQGTNFSSGNIELPYGAKEEFVKLLQENSDLKEVTMEIETKPTRVLTPRVKPTTEDDFDK